MITGDKVVLLEWDAAPSLTDAVGVVKQWREVGRELHNISFEYLVSFGEGKPTMWIPGRFLRRL